MTFGGGFPEVRRSRQHVVVFGIALETRCAETASDTCYAVMFSEGQVCVVY